MNTIIYVGEHQRTYDVHWHQHEHWELVYCTDGEGVFQFRNGENIPYRKGQTVAIPPGQVHMNSSAEGFTNLYLTMERPFFPYRSPFVVNDDAQGHMKIAFSEARHYYLSGLDRQELLMSALGDLIAGYMVVYRDNAERSPAVEKIRATILSRYSDPSFELDAEIRQMPFHYDYLRKLFQKEMGMTPLKYMTDLRMKKARAFLAAAWTRGCSMAEVAESCGFADAAYFSRVFKRYFNCSPAQFARRFDRGGDGGAEPE